MSRKTQMMLILIYCISYVNQQLFSFLLVPLNYLPTLATIRVTNDLQCIVSILSSCNFQYFEFTQSHSTEILNKRIQIPPSKQRWLKCTGDPTSYAWLREWIIHQLIPARCLQCMVIYAYVHRPVYITNNGDKITFQTWRS